MVAGASYRSRTVRPQRGCRRRIVRAGGPGHRGRRAIGGHARPASARRRAGGTSPRRGAALRRPDVRRRARRAHRAPLDRSGDRPGRMCARRAPARGPVHVGSGLDRVLARAGVCPRVSHARSRAVPDHAGDRIGARSRCPRRRHARADSTRLHGRIPGGILATSRGLSRSSGACRYFVVRPRTRVGRAHGAAARGSRVGGLADTACGAAGARGARHRVSAGGGRTSGRL